LLRVKSRHRLIQARSDQQRIACPQIADGEPQKLVCFFCQWAQRKT
jgi:hypothetical protein